MDNDYDSNILTNSRSKYNTLWSEDETLLAFYYYCQIPFGKIHKGNPVIIQIANMLGRTPSAVSRKMGNLGHFDPELIKRGITGLSNASKTDELIVKTYYNNMDELYQKAQEVQNRLAKQSSKLLIELPNEKCDLVLEDIPEGTEKETLTKVRINQQFFRKAVLSSYNNKCCITGINNPDLLIASHIKPWRDSDPITERTNPSNGLCLNALHDKAFDRGFITVLPNYTIKVSSELKKLSLKNDAILWLTQCDNKKIILPDRFYPDKDLLEYHNARVFKG